MNDTFPSVKPDSLLQDSFSLLYLHKVSSIIVTDSNNELAGVISTVDFQNGFAKGQQYVHEAMTKDVITAIDTETLNFVFDKLTDHHIECMPVVKENNKKKVIGIITFRDIEKRYETELVKLQSKKKFTIEEIEDDF